MTIPTEVAALRKPDFGDYVRIEQKRYGVPNEIYDHKVVARLVSNAWVDVPVQSPAKESLHDECVEVVACICCGVQEADVRKYRLSDVMLVESALTAKAEAVAWQAKRSDGSPLAVWEACTREAYDATILTGRYLGFENGPAGVARALYAHAPPAVPVGSPCTCPSGDGSLRWPCPQHPPVESLGRDAEPAGELDAKMRARGLPKIADALGYSRNFAAANPHLTQTAKDHITGLCDMLDIAAAHKAPPPASVPDGWAAPNVLTEEMIEAADDAHVAAYSDPSVPVSLEMLHRAIYEAFRRASPGKVQGCGTCEGRGFIADGDLSGGIWKTKCSCCNGRGWHVDAMLATTPPTNQEGAAP